MFEKGNKIWQLADPNKVGRPLNFETPIDLWNEVVNYFQWVDSNPIIKQDFKGKDADKVDYELQRPYTWQSLYVYLGVTNLDYYKTKDEFLGILTHIGNIIYSCKYDGALVGIFNYSMVSRDLGLMERSDITSNGNEIKQPTTVINLGSGIKPNEE